MDIFCEYLVKKKSINDTLKKAGLFFACALFCLLIIYISFTVAHWLITFMPIIVAAAIFASVVYSRNFSIEYEYIFTNGVLDIDIIKGRTIRKTLVCVPCRKIESMSRLTKSYSSDNITIDAIYDESRSGKYVLTFSDGGIKTDVLFQPPEKLLLNMKKYNPRNIIL